MQTSHKITLVFLSFLVPLSVFAFTVPARPTTYVNDYAGILSADQVAGLETKLETFEKQTTNEIAVVTIPSLDGDTVANVAQEIFTAWGIGKKDKNNGVLFLISLAEHKTRIQTGYGVEGDLTDLGTSYIQQDIVTPAFRAGDYAGGINGAVDKMIEALGGSQIVPDGYTTTSGNSSGNAPWQFIFIAGFIALQWLAAVLAKSKSWWGGGIVGGVVGVGIGYFLIHSLLVAIPLVLLLGGMGLLLDFIVSRAYTKYKDTGGPRPPWFLGGGGFGGGSRGGGGGFGGFGGGMSGGGGSSGGW